MLPRSLLVFTALAGLVTSQIDPNSVDLPTRGKSIPTMFNTLVGLYLILSPY